MDTPRKLNFFSKVLIIIFALFFVLFILNYLQIISFSKTIPFLSQLPQIAKAPTQRLDPKDKLARNYAAQIYPYDPLSPMVKNLTLNYTITGALQKIEPTKDNKQKLTLSNELDPVMFNFIVDPSDSQIKITNYSGQAVPIDKFMLNHTVTVNLLVDTKNHTEKVTSISVNQ